MSEQCDEFSRLEMTYITAMALLCLLLGALFVCWLMFCCFVVYKNRLSENGRLKRQTPSKSGSQGLALVNTNQPLDWLNESLATQTPVKTRTFSREEKKDISNLLQRNEIPNDPPVYDNLTVAANGTERSSISFDTFVVNKKESAEYQHLAPIVNMNLPPVAPCETPGVGEVNDKEDLVLVRNEQLLAEAENLELKLELTEKQPNDLLEEK